MRWCRLGSGPLVRVRVGRMSVDIRNVSSGEFRSLLQDKEVLRVLFFGGLGEIERTSVTPQDVLRREGFPHARKCD